MEHSKPGYDTIRHGGSMSGDGDVREKTDKARRLTGGMSCLTFFSFPLGWKMGTEWDVQFAEGR